MLLLTSCNGVRLPGAILSTNARRCETRVTFTHATPAQAVLPRSTLGRHPRAHTVMLGARQYLSRCYKKNTEGRAMGVPPLLPLPAGAMQSTSAPSSMSLQMPSMLPSAAAATRPSFNFTSTALPNAGQTVLLCDYQQQTRVQADNLQAQQRSQRHRVDETNRWR